MCRKDFHFKSFWEQRIYTSFLPILHYIKAFNLKVVMSETEYSIIEVPPIFSAYILNGL